MPIEKNHYTCIPATDIDSILTVDKKVFPQAYLEQCKYKLKKRRPIKILLISKLLMMMKKIMVMTVIMKMKIKMKIFK